MNEPLHPGALIEPLLLAPTGLSQSALARHLGFNQPQPVNELVKGKRGITPKMAILLERASDGQYPAEFWLLLQSRYDLARSRSVLPDRRAALVEPAGVSGSSSALRSSGQASLMKVARQLQALA